MIFAELKAQPSLSELLIVLQDSFGPVEWGDQGTASAPDAYFWITREGEKVSVDNLTSIAFQVKCTQLDSLLVAEVIEVLSKSFDLKILDTPELEAHE